MGACSYINLPAFNNLFSQAFKTIWVKRASFILLAISSFTCIKVNAQCTTLGQTPSTAFPVCGTAVFAQDSVPICTNGVINVPGCSGGVTTYYDTNPFWYRFICYVAGTLGFGIKPQDAAHDDYDWQLFDITNHDANDVYTVDSLFVCGNWSGDAGVTGASLAGTANVECATFPGVTENTFSAMPLLKLGHTYLLLVSHYTQTQSGYKLSFGGGTAVITDAAAPALQKATANCPGTQIGIKLSKKMKCLSLAADGSDFTLSPQLATITSATGYNCNNGFDMDSVVLTLSNPLPGGNYTLSAQNGSDANTLIDNCGDSVPVGNTVYFAASPNKAVNLDSIAPVGCAPQSVQLVFTKNILCSSIAPDGSDFTVTGPYPLTITAASGTCDVNGTTTGIKLSFSSAVIHKGDYVLTLVKGSDGNTILDECNDETPAGETLTFSTADTVSAGFTVQLLLGCRLDTVVVSNNGNNSINSWYWAFEDGFTDTLPTETRIYKDYGTKTATLTVSNGVCTSTVSQNYLLDNQIKAMFTSPSVLCPSDVAIFKDSSIGNITTWNWYFGNGNTSNMQYPPAQTYIPSTGETYYPVRLIVGNAIPCYDTGYQQLKVLYNCYIAVPSAFTPNGDGINDYLYPLNAYKATNLEFRVFNRWGQQVFETRDWTKKWDGTVNGIKQGNGVYVWFLTYTDSGTGQTYSSKGTTTLIR